MIFFTKNKIKKAFSLMELSIVILIIGIIIGGVTQGSRLVGAMRLATAQNLTKVSPVGALKGLLFWYETTLDDSFLVGENENGTVITTWKDINPQSTTKHHAYAAQKTNAALVSYNLAGGATSGNSSGPTYISKGMGDLPTLRFTNEATTYRYVAVDGTAKNTNADDITFFFVMNYRSGSGWAVDRVCSNDGVPVDCGATNNSGNPIWGIQINGEDQPIYFARRDDAGNMINGDYYANTGYNSSPNSKMIITLQRRYGVNFSAYVNGTLMVTDTDTIGALSIDPIKIGRHANSDSDTIDFDVSEAILFSEHIEAADRQAVEQYLGKKYGIAVAIN